MTFNYLHLNNIFIAIDGFEVDESMLVTLNFVNEAKEGYWKYHVNVFEAVNGITGEVEKRYLVDKFFDTMPSGNAAWTWNFTPPVVMVKRNCCPGIPWMWVLPSGSWLWSGSGLMRPGSPRTAGKAVPAAVPIAC